MVAVCSYRVKQALRNAPNSRSRQQRECACRDVGNAIGKDHDCRSERDCSAEREDDVHASRHFRVQHGEAEQTEQAIRGELSSWLESLGAAVVSVRVLPEEQSDEGGRP